MSVKRAIIADCVGLKEKDIMCALCSYYRPGGMCDFWNQETIGKDFCSMWSNKRKENHYDTEGDEYYGIEGKGEEICEVTQERDHSDGECGGDDCCIL